MTLCKGKDDDLEMNECLSRDQCNFGTFDLESYGDSHDENPDYWCYPRCLSDCSPDC